MRASPLTREVSDQLVAMLRAGNHTDVACAAAGVDGHSFGRWMERGRSGRAVDLPFVEFRQLVVRARAEAEARAVTQIARAAAEDWRAAAWLLEREAPDRWARPAIRPADVADLEPAPVEGPDRLDELAARRYAREGR